jgi:AmmeMemoRadiSam system protein B
VNFSRLKSLLLLAASIFVFTLLSRHLPNQKLQTVVRPSPAPEVFLESYFRDKSKYDESFSKFEDMPKVHVLAAITSHHFLARDLIAQTFSGIDPAGINTVIIVSPDHFNQPVRSGTLVQTTDTVWHTPFGKMDSDQNQIGKILQENGVLSDINTFRSEHGVYTLIPFAKKTFPAAVIIPLVLRQSPDYQYFYNLGEKTSKLISLHETVLVISSDFAHNTSAEKAKLADRKSIGLLPNKQLEDASLITNDCKQCTAFLFGYLKNTNTDSQLLFNKNSFGLSGQDPENVTSYVGIYFLAR